jgi:hypothetical protein
MTDRKASGRQVSYRKAIDATVAALRECGVDSEQATLLAEKHMRSALSERQLASLETAERPPDSESTPLHPWPLKSAADVEPGLDAPAVRIFQRQRDDNDAMVWVEVDRVETRASAGVALSTWLNERYPEPLAGSYRAEGNGGHAEDQWTAEAA